MGSDDVGSAVVDIRYVGFGDDLQEGSRRVVEEVQSMVAMELTLDKESVHVLLQPLPMGHVDSETTYVQNAKHIVAWLKDNSWLEYLHMTKNETTIIRHKCVVVYLSTNLGLLHDHKNRITGQLARTLSMCLVSQWTGEKLLCIFTHDGTRRLWSSPVQHSDKFGVGGKIL